jgi:cytochrome c peroxidase
MKIPRPLVAAVSLGLLFYGAAGRADDSLYVFPCPEPGGARVISPLPIAHRLDPARVALGRMLFNDPRLSRGGSITCASCHVIASGGDDGRARSIGAGGAEGAINAPSVLNRGFDFRQFWDGRAASLEEQVNGPLTHPKEMASSWEIAIARLADDDAMKRLFRDAYSSGPTPDAVRDAIASYERSLFTPDSPFDRYLCGDESALAAEAREGFRLFQDLGCISCHQGRNVGGNMFQRFGVFGDYIADRGNPTDADLGRFGVTGLERDRQVFKVPSLRNVELTGPYFHDGSALTLEAAVAVMGRYQLGESSRSRQLAGLVAFLGSLTGRVPQ